MCTRVSNGKTDYFYYPIEYPNIAVSTIVSLNQFQNFNTVWSVVQTNKAKVSISFKTDYQGEDAPIIHIISIGF